MQPVFDFVILGATGWLIFIGFIQMILVCILLILSVFYLVIAQNTLSAISVENRKLHPKQVWLSLIPLFGFIWMYIIVNRITDSLREEFNKRNIKVPESGFGIRIGIAYCTLLWISTVLIMEIGGVTGIAGIVCMIIYLSKLNRYRKELQQNYPF
jgi:hypothetical protein